MDMVMATIHIDIIDPIGTTAITMAEPITVVSATIGTIATITIIVK
jgi:hypothetical protein